MRTLIIKNNINDFERFFSKHMETDDVTVVSPYIENTKFVHYLSLLIQRLNFDFLHSLVIGSWKNDLYKYDKVIVFDKASPYILKWLYKRIGKRKLYFYLWNIPSFDINKYKCIANIACFDEYFAKEHNLLYWHQFYFDNLKVDDKEINNDVLFIGADKDRIEVLNKLSVYFTKNCINYDITLVNNKLSKSYTSQNGIKFSKEMISYEKVLEKISSSKCILELVKEGQKGLTLRSLEALFFNKKLITNNQNILNFDFYDKNNIFVIKDDCFNDLIDFLDLPSVKIDSNIKEKYSYDNWINKVKNC